LGKVVGNRMAKEEVAFVVAGIQRSGTNFVEALIKQNLTGGYNGNCRNTYRNGGFWKHAWALDSPNGIPGPNPSNVDFSFQKLVDKIDSGELKVLHLVKHPYAWAYSITDKQVDIKKTYPRVTRKNKQNQDEWNLFSRNDINIAEAIRLWQEHTIWWWEFSQRKNIQTFKYEDIITNTKYGAHSFLSKALPHWGVRYERPMDEISIPGKVSQSNDFTQERRDYYANFKIKLDWHVIEKINSILNPHFIKELIGYNLITDYDEFLKYKI